MSSAWNWSHTPHLQSHSMVVAEM